MPYKPPAIEEPREDLQSLTRSVRQIKYYLEEVVQTLAIEEPNEDLPSLTRVVRQIKRYMEE